jgi:hypothetical protein
MPSPKSGVENGVTSQFVAGKSVSDASQTKFASPCLQSRILRQKQQVRARKPHKDGGFAGMRAPHKTPQKSVYTACRRVKGTETSLWR